MWIHCICMAATISVYLNLSSLFRRTLKTISQPTEDGGWLILFKGEQCPLQSTRGSCSLLFDSRLLFLLSRSFSMKGVASKAVTGSATLTAWTPLGTSTVATPSVSAVGTGWPMRSPSTWVTSTFLALESTLTTTAGWASTTVCAPARCSPL